MDEVLRGVCWKKGGIARLLYLHLGFVSLPLSVCVTVKCGCVCLQYCCAYVTVYNRL